MDFNDVKRISTPFCPSGVALDQFAASVSGMVLVLTMLGKGSRADALELASKALDGISHASGALSILEAAVAVVKYDGPVNNMLRPQ